MICSICKQEKPEGDFYWQFKTKGIRSRNCKKCSNEFTKRWYWNNRQKTLAVKKEWSKKRRAGNRAFILSHLKTHPCINCKEADPIVLEFHHTGTSKKEETIANMCRSSFSVDRIKKEISKCEVLCANCHRRKTAKERGWYKSL